MTARRRQEAPRGPQNAPRGPTEAPKKPPRSFREAPKRPFKEEPPQTTKSPSSYIPIVMHKAKDVEAMVSYLEPTKEQMAKREILRQEQEAERLHKLEEERLERRRRANMNLTQKQKQHAEKLYFLLDGQVSRKEIEDSALSAKHSTKVRVEGNRNLQLDPARESL